MRVPRGHGIADPKQLKGPLRIGRDGLDRSGKQLFVVHCSEIPRQRLQLKIQIIERQGAVVDDDLVDVPLFAYAAIVAADLGRQPVAVASYGFEPKSNGERDIEFLQTA